MDAEETIQDLLVKVWQKKEQFALVDNKEAWCMTVTRNLAYDKIRARKQNAQDIEEHYSIKDTAAQPDKILESKDELNQVKAVINSLPSDLSEVIQLREIEQLTYQEIAEITGWNLNKVKVSIHRARKLIRESMKQAQL